MKITKNLKHANFEWDDEAKTFTITEEDGNRITLNKVYAFAFMRFVVRMAQRNWLRKKTIVNKAQDVIDELETEHEENENQMVLFKEDDSQ